MRKHLSINGAKNEQLARIQSNNSINIDYCGLYESMEPLAHWHLCAYSKSSPSAYSVVSIAIPLFQLNFMMSQGSCLNWVEDVIGFLSHIEANHNFDYAVRIVIQLFYNAYRLAGTILFVHSKLVAGIKLFRIGS